MGNITTQIRNAYTDLGSMLITDHQPRNRKAILNDKLSFIMRSSQQLCKCLKNRTIKSNDKVLRESKLVLENSVLAHCTVHYITIKITLNHKLKDIDAGVTFS